MTHVRTLLSHSSKIFTALIAAALIFTWSTNGQIAEANHQPANKFAAAGAGIDDVDENSAHVVLSETMKVPTTHDLALSATAECSILTYLRSEGGEEETHSTENAEGRVDMWITIDGTPVPVQTNGYTGDEAHPEWSGADDGKVTFCNREYERYIGDAEQDEDDEDKDNEAGGQGGDGIDEERDFIATRNANAFNWFALNVASYDKPDYDGVTGNNVVVVELWAEYARTEPRDCAATTGPDLPIGDSSEGEPQDTCSDAYIGKRTLIAEPTNASVHEAVEPYDDGTTDGDQEAPTQEEEPQEPPNQLCVGDICPTQRD